LLKKEKLKKGRKEKRDTLTGFPFVRLMVHGGERRRRRRREGVQGEGAGYKMPPPLPE